MPFNKKVFDKKCKKWILDNKWRDLSPAIEAILFTKMIDNIPFKPQYLIARKFNGDTEETLFFLNFFQKGDWSKAVKLDFEGTGIDWYKYKFLQAIQTITGIQIGLVMWNETTDKFVFRQLDQLPKPIIFFKGMACYAHELRKRNIEFDCFECFKNNPSITDECIHKRKSGRRKKKREMAMWKVSEFANEFIIQSKLL